MGELYMKYLHTLSKIKELYKPVKNQIYSFFTKEIDLSNWATASNPRRNKFLKQTNLLEKRDETGLLKNWELYKSDGFAFAGVWQLVLSITSPGYIITEEHGIQEWLENINFLNKIIVLIHSSIIFGDGYAEIIKNRFGQPINLKPLFPLLIEYDEKGKKYVYNTEDKQIRIPKDNILHIRLFPSLNIYGDALLTSLQTTIDHHSEIDKAVFNAIKRHGFPKFHIKVKPDKTGRRPPPEKLSTILWDFRELNERNEFISTDLVDIEEIDKKGIPQAEDYQQYMTNLIATSFLLPIEILGMAARGSTEATAKVRVQKFEETIAFFRRNIEESINSQLIFQVSKVAKFKFKDDLSEETKLARAKWIEKVLSVGVVTKNEIREMLGLKPLESGGDELVTKTVDIVEKKQNKSTIDYEKNKQNGDQKSFIEFENLFEEVVSESKEDFEEWYKEQLKI